MIETQYKPSIIKWADDDATSKFPEEILEILVSNFSKRFSLGPWMPMMQTAIMLSGLSSELKYWWLLKNFHEY